MASVREPASVRLALALGMAALLGAWSLAAAPGDAHSPTTTGEGSANPAGLAGIQFYGPPGTAIETTACPPIPDADRPTYYPTPPQLQHIGHVNGVVSLHATPLTDFIRVNSIDLYHLEGSYSDPRMLEGPHPVNDGSSSLMMGSDGYFRGQMMSSFGDEVGDDLRIVDVHDARSYCVYGSDQHDGPYYFIHSTWGDQFGAVTDTYMDLADYYVPIFTARNPAITPTMEYVFLVASAFNDEPPPPVDFSATGSDGWAGWDCASTANALDLYPVQFAALPVPAPYTYEWDFGDGGRGQGRTPTHAYADDGPYLVTLTVTDGSKSYSRSHVCSVFNVRPAVGDPCRSFFAEEGLATFYAPASDPDGAVEVFEWDFGDGSPRQSGAIAAHAFPHAGTYLVTLAVRDDDWDSTRPTKAVTDAEASGWCDIPGRPNHPPILDRLPRISVPVGTSVDFTVSGHDPDGDFPLTLSSRGVPPEATFDPQTGAFHVASDRPASFPDLSFRITDPGGLHDEGTAFVLFFDERSDSDLDGVPDAADLCPAVADRDQRDLDRDGQGDACQGAAPDAPDSAAAPAPAPPDLPDRDADGLADASDNCPAVANRGQDDLDGDGLGDLCDADLDGDGVADLGAAGAALDACPFVPDPGQGDADGDGVGDACDADGTGGAAGKARAPPAPLASAPAAAETGILAQVGLPVGLGLLALVATAAVLLAVLGRRVRGDP